MRYGMETNKNIQQGKKRKYTLNKSSDLVGKKSSDTQKSTTRGKYSPIETVIVPECAKKRSNSSRTKLFRYLPGFLSILNWDYI